MQEKERYFAASNSAKGFKNYFDEIFSAKDIGRIYILKGGPGTGKSRFMREVAQAAEARGIRVEYFYCSSDPDSLDAVLLGGNLCAVIDGTPPHSLDPSYPGSVDEIINLGDFWDEDMLISKRDEIIDLSERKKKAYREAYRFLEASGFIYSDIKANVYDCVDRRKLLAAAKRIFAHIPDGDGFEKKIRIQNSLGMRGEYGFDTFGEKASKRYYILDVAESAYLMLSEIYRRAYEKKLSVVCSYSPVEPEEIDGLYFPTLKTSFCKIKRKIEVKENEKIINMERFIKKEALQKIKGNLKFSLRCRDALLDEAKKRLCEASKAHFMLEDIYISAMDFERKEKASK